MVLPQDPSTDRGAERAIGQVDGLQAGAVVEHPRHCSRPAPGPTANAMHGAGRRAGRAAMQCRRKRWHVLQLHHRKQHVAEAPRPAAAGTSRLSVPQPQGERLLRHHTQRRGCPERLPAPAAVGDLGCSIQGGGLVL